MSATPTLYFDTRRQKNDGTFPVKLRITFLRKQQYYPTGINLTPVQWEKVGKPKPREEYIRDSKAILETILDRAERVIRDIPIFTFPEFESRYAGSTQALSDSVIGCFERYIEQLNKEGRVNTASSYTCALNAFKKYHTERRQLTFRDITPQWLQGFETWMLNQGNSITTVGIYGRSMRAIFNTGVEDGVVSKDAYPFSKRRYQIPTGKNVKKALVLADIEKIYNYPAEPMSTEDRVKDLWLFSYLCNGINPKDIAHLTYQQVGVKQIQFIREKTKRTKREVKPIAVTITDDVRRIIGKWGQKPATPHQYVFNILAPGMNASQELATVKQFTKIINKYIRRIAIEVGIEKDVTTYTARHSFATVLKRSGASNEYIGESLGHADLRSTENYLDSFEDEMKQQFASALTAFRPIEPANPEANP